MVDHNTGAVTVAIRVVVISSAVGQGAMGDVVYGKNDAVDVSLTVVLGDAALLAAVGGAKGITGGPSDP